MPVFLYTDIEGSTQLWEEHRPAMGTVLDRHDEILMGCLDKFGGRHVKNTGDGMMAVFSELDAHPLACALAMQQMLAAEKWTDIEELRIRVAIHAGPAEYRAGDYFGPVVNRLARLLATAWGGQIIVTPEAMASATLPKGASLRDLGVHLLKDLSEPQQVYGLIHRMLPIQEFPPLRSMSSQPNNLPRQQSPLVGRQAELAKIADLISNPECRLLNLVAPGGMGKTRLGLQAAAEQTDSFRHGVYFVPLAGVASAENIPLAIANALKLSFYGSEELEDQLLSYLSEKQILLLLDNFEHLIDGVGIVANILNAAPFAKILVTSRRHLPLQLEWSFEVSGLPIPENGEIQAAAAYDSVDLFLQSARRFLPGFAFSEEEQKAIVRVCKLVDGMPLAIELAAAWVRTLTCQEIADEIERDMAVLETQMQDVPVRQRSVSAVFEHSWLGLSPAAQSVFKRISLFRGGFDRAAAQQVTDTSIMVLSELSDSALLIRDSSGRFQIHELLRQFAASKFSEDGEACQENHQRHAAYFTTLLKGLEKAFISGARIEPIERITLDLDNVLRGWQWAVTQGAMPLIEDSMRSLFWFYEAKALYSEGEELFKSAGDTLAERFKARQTPADSLPLTLLNLRLREAWFASRMSRFEKAQAVAGMETSEVAELLLKQGDLEGHWVASGVVENTLYGMGDYLAARSFLERHDDRLERDHSYSETWPWAKGQNVANLGRVAGALGDYNQARQLLQKGVNILRPLGDHVGVMLYLHTLGGIVHKLGYRQQAMEIFQEGLEQAESHSYSMGKVLALGNLGTIAYVEGDYGKARDYFEDSLALSEEIGDSRGRALALTNLGRIAVAQGDYDEARRLFDQGLTITDRTGNRRGTALTMIRLSTVHRLMGDLNRAHDLSQRSWDICREIGYRKGAIQAQISCGEVALALRDNQGAQRYFSESLADSLEVGFVSGIMRSHIGLGKKALAVGELEKAEQHLRDGLLSGARNTHKRVELGALLSLATIWLDQGADERGGALMVMVRDHQATDYFIRQKAAELLKELKERMEPADYERINTSDRELTLMTVQEMVFQEE